MKECFVYFVAFTFMGITYSVGDQESWIIEKVKIYLVVLPPGIKCCHLQ